MDILSLPQDRAKVSLPVLPDAQHTALRQAARGPVTVFTLCGRSDSHLSPGSHPPASLLHCSSAPDEPALRCGFTAGTHAPWRRPEEQRPGPPWPAGPGMCPFSSSGPFCLPIPLPWPPSSCGPHLGWFVSWAASPRPILVPR